MKKQTRSEARERAFSLIFQLYANSDEPEFLIEQMLEEFPESVDNLAYIKGAALGVMEKRDEILEQISSVLPKNRPITRLSRAVTVILMLAVYEISNVDDVPEKVAINEAVELAKKYAEDDAPAFVNGVLGGVVAK